MTALKKIVDRVKNLLEISHRPNINEGATAAAQAQKIMSRHNITELMLGDPAGSGESIKADLFYVHNNTRMPIWYGQLCRTLCDINQCVSYKGPRSDGLTGLGIIGRSSDAQIVRYLFSYLTREIERLRDYHSDQLGSPGRQWRNDFCIGAMITVAGRLRDAAAQARADMKQEAYARDARESRNSIVLVNNAVAKLDRRAAEVAAWVKDNMNMGKGHRYTRHNISSDGRTTGALAGRNINITDGHRKLDRGARGTLNKNTRSEKPNPENKPWQRD